MIKKIEAWFRNLIHSEVFILVHAINLVETKLDGERLKLSQHAEATFKTFEGDAAQLLREFQQKLAAEAAFVVAEKDRQLAAAHRDVAEAHEKLAKLSHWQADSQTVAADHSLKLVK